MGVGVLSRLGTRFSGRRLSDLRRACRPLPPHSLLPGLHPGSIGRATKAARRETVGDAASAAPSIGPGPGAGEVRGVRLPFLAIAATVAALSLTAPATAQENVVSPLSDATYTAFALRALDHAIAPDMIALATATATLDVALTAFCAAPATADRAPVDAAFADVVTAWARIVPLQIEPLRTDARRERFFFWPDPRGIMLRQLQPLIAQRDPTAIDPASLAGKSAALQGVGALEFLLYGTGAEAILQPGEDGAFRCAYATAISANLDAIATALVTDTALDSAFRALVAAPGAANPLYRNANEATIDIVMSTVTATELADDQILTPMIGATPEEARPRGAPLWRSNLTLAFVEAMLAVPADIFERADLVAALPAAQSWVPEQLRGEAQNAARTLDAIALTAGVEAAATDPANRQRLVVANFIADNLEAIAGITLPAALGIDLGFNALDGD